MGKNPFMGALLGGATGGAFGGAGGFGSGFGLGEGSLLSGVTGVEAAAPSFATGGYANLGANALNSGTQGLINFSNLGSNMITDQAGNLTNGLQLDKFYPTANFTDEGLSFADKGLSSAEQMFTNPLTNMPRVDPLAEINSAGNFINPTETFADKAFKSIQNAPSSIKESFYDMPTSQKLNLGLQGYTALNQPTPPIQPAAGYQPIQKKPFNEQSTMISASPSYGTSKEEMAKSQAAQLYNLAHLTEQDKRKIGNFYTSLIG
jgi:hypothetical protein